MFWVLFCASLVLFCAQTIQAFGIVAFHAEFFEKKPTIVVDAGHGGEDGGAVGINGLVEKDVNLAIALALAEDLKAANFPVVLVREGDYSVGDQSLGTIAERKRSDTKSRAQLVEETGECVLISIHQNKFEQSQYSGAQMFYSPNNPESAALAECIRQSVVDSLQPQNTRQNKEAGGVWVPLQPRGSGPPRPRELPAGHGGSYLQRADFLFRAAGRGGIRLHFLPVLWYNSRRK